jgi:hypothetical protein
MKTVFNPLRVKDLSYIEKYLVECMNKYSDRSIKGLNGMYRKMSDYIVFIKNQGCIQISKEVENLLTTQGYIGRSQVVFEHKTPLNLYKKELHSLFQKKDIKGFINLLLEKTDTVLITQLEDNTLSEKGFTSVLPTHGDRYELSGIKISNTLLPVQFFVKDTPLRRSDKINLSKQLES